MLKNINVALPSVPHFICELAVRVNDLNYGGHLGIIELQNILHEGRIELLSKHKLSEVNFYSGALIMTECWTRQYQECFQSDILILKISIINVSKIRFEIFYEVLKKSSLKLVAHAITKLTYMSKDKKPSKLPKNFLSIFKMKN